MHTCFSRLIILMSAATPATYLWWRDNQDRGRPYSKARYTRDIQPYLNGTSDSDFIDLLKCRNLPLDVAQDVQLLLEEERQWQDAAATGVTGNTATEKDQVLSGIRARKLVIANNFS